MDLTICQKTNTPKKAKNMRNLTDENNFRILRLFKYTVKDSEHNLLTGT